MMAEFEDQVASLQPGQYSQPFRTKNGIHIVRVDGITSASEQPVDALAAEIKERLYNAALEERYNRWLREDLRQQHHVEILPE
jgi:peptidyl-prolyl cis-trans isomerase SurA